MFSKGGKSSFITSMYVVIIPILEWLLPCIKGRMTPLAWTASVASLLGLYLLSGCAEQSCIGSQIG